jgi:hypothetical protein
MDEPYGVRLETNERRPRGRGHAVRHALGVWRPEPEYYALSSLERAPIRRQDLKTRMGRSFWSGGLRNKLLQSGSGTKISPLTIHKLRNINATSKQTLASH